MVGCLFQCGKDEFPVDIDGRSLEGIALGLGLNPDAHIFIRGRVPVPMTLVPEEGDVIKAIAVASGG